MQNKTSKYKYIIGIDEVGRGPLAGPVAVCSFTLPRENYKLLIENGERELGVKIKDSKKLSKKQRELWFGYLQISKQNGLCDYSVAFVSPQMIDKFGIVKCIQKALNKSLEKVTSEEMIFVGSSDLLAENSFSEDGSSTRPPQKSSPASFFIFLDGGLKAPVEYINQETIIKGDELHPIISMASIMAKVSRDRVMTKYSREYIDYGFEKHSGYGTKFHYDAIKKYGVLPIHRKSYLKK